MPRTIRFAARLQFPGHGTSPALGGAESPMVRNLFMAPGNDPFTRPGKEHFAAFPGQVPAMPVIFRQPFGKSGGSGRSPKKPGKDMRLPKDVPFLLTEGYSSPISPMIRSMFGMKARGSVSLNRIVKDRTELFLTGKGIWLPVPTGTTSW